MEDGEGGPDRADEDALAGEVSDEALEIAGALRAETMNSHVSSFFLPPCC